MPPIEELRNTTKRLQDHWRPRNARFDKWYALRAMKDDNEQRGRVSVALNTARTHFDLAHFFLSHRPPTVRVPILGKPNIEQEHSGRAEQMLLGVHRSIDKDRRGGGYSSWQRDMSDFLLSTGWWSDLNMIHKGKDGQPIFIADVLDPSEVFAEFGYNRIERVVHTYPASLAVVQAKQRILNWQGAFRGDGTQEVSINSIWEYGPNDEVQNTVYVEGLGRTRIGIESAVIAVPTMTVEGMTELPLRTGSANGWAKRSQTMELRTPQQLYGESILEAGRPIYDAKNLWATLTFQSIADTVQPTYMARGRGGRFTVSEQDMIQGIIPVDLDEEIAAVRKPDIPASTMGMVMPLLDRAEQRAGISDLFRGITEGQDLAGAGFAISLLEPNALSKLGSFAKELEYIGSTRDSMYIEALRNGDFENIILAGSTQTASDTRRLFYHEFDVSKDLPEHSFVDWELDLATPSQMTQTLAMARQAIQEGDLLDIDTVLERVLKVEDPAAVKERIEIERTRKSPLVQQVEQTIELQQYANALRREARAFRERGRTEDFVLYNRAATMVEQILEQQTRPQQPAGQGASPPQLPGIPGGMIPQTPGASAPPPEAAGVQLGRQLEGGLTPAQGIPGA